MKNPYPPADEHPINWPEFDPRHAAFGKAMWDYIVKMGGDFCGDEWSEDVLPLAEKAGLCHRVAYDPEKHGWLDEIEPGDLIWWWGAEIRDRGHGDEVAL